LIKILDRYIFLELLEPFLFGLGSFTAILSSSMLMFELVRAVIQKGMPLAIALQIFALKLPGIMIYIFPMATLLAALLAFSRLSHDSEVIAFRASGLTLFRLIVPVVVFGLLVSFVNLAFSELIMPEASKTATNLLIATTTKTQPKLQKNVFLPEMERGSLKRIFYAESMQGEEMTGVVVQEFSQGKLGQIINARTARWVKGQSQWLFRDGTVYLLAENGEYRHVIRFAEQYVAIKYTPADFSTGDRNPDEMNINNLRDYIALKEKMGVQTTDLKIQLNMKFAIPFASLVFALLGAPLGLSPRRASGSIGLGISIIVIFFYYITMFIAMAIGEMKVIPPGLAAWLPNLATGAVGLYILRQKAEQ
jgi:lipopolysaccharide export system permease protein